MLTVIEKHSKYILKVDSDALIGGFSALVTGWKQAEDRIDDLLRPTLVAASANEYRFELPEAARGISPYIIDTMDIRKIKEAYERDSSRRIIQSPLPSIPSRLLRRVG